MAGKTSAATIHKEPASLAPSCCHATSDLDALRQVLISHPATISAVPPDASKVKLAAASNALQNCSRISLRPVAGRAKGISTSIEKSKSSTTNDDAFSGSQADVASQMSVLPQAFKAFGFIVSPPPSSSPANPVQTGTATTAPEESRAMPSNDADVKTHESHTTRCHLAGAQ